MPSKNRVRPLTDDIKPAKNRAKKGVKVSGGEKGSAAISYVEQPPEHFILEVIRRAEELGMGKRALEFTNPQAMAQALWMRAQMLPLNRIHKETGIDRSSLRRFLYRQDDTIEKLRGRFARKFAIAAEATSDLLMEKLDMMADDPEQLKAVSPDRLAVTLGVVTDKAAMLSGMASVTIEHRRGPSIDDAAAMIAAAKARVADKLRENAIEAVIVDEH